MSRKQNSAAIIGLLDAIKSEGIKPISENQTAHSIENNKKNIKDILNSNHQEKITYFVDKISPSQCKIWNMANRLTEYINDDSCDDLINSIQLVGQQIPAIVRPLGNEEFELICGARRLYVCRKLKINMLAAIVELSDQDALLIMDAENRPREDISPYERALDYANWIKNGFFENQNAVAEAIGFRKSWFSKLMALALLDPLIIKAFGHPAKVKQLWGYNLHKICSTSTTFKSAMLERASELVGKDLPPETIYKQLCAAKDVLQPHYEVQSYWVKNIENKNIFKVKTNKLGKVSLSFSAHLSEQQITGLLEKIKEVTNECS